MLQAERDEAVARSKKLARQCDKLTVQLTDARAQIRDLNAQLADAAEYKVPASRSRTLTQCDNMTVQLKRSQIVKLPRSHQDPLCKFDVSLTLAI